MYITKVLAPAMLLWSLAACGGDEGELGNNLAANTHCPSNTYVGNLGGLQATAKVTVEPLVTYTYVQGQITSATAAYIFDADMVGERGWGDMVDQLNNERFRIQIDLTQSGFVLTANPFGGAASYTFQCQ